jgi:hypothetical protein
VEVKGGIHAVEKAREVRQELLCSAGLPSAVFVDLPWWIPIRSLNSNFCARGILTIMSAVSSRTQSAHSYHSRPAPVKCEYKTDLSRIPAEIPTLSI